MDSAATAAAAAAAAAPAFQSVLPTQTKLERCAALRINRPQWMEKCLRAKLFKIADVLMQSEIELMEELDLHLFEVKELVAMLAAACTPSPSPALQLFLQSHGVDPATAPAAISMEKLRSIRDRDPTQLILDRAHPATRINKGSITELVGPAGIGKTQLCLTLCCIASLPREHGGLGGGTMYLDTERVFSGDRLIEIAQKRFPEYYKDAAVLKAMSSSVRHVPVSSSQELMNVMANLETNMLQFHCKLLIIDSIAAVARFLPATAPSAAAAHNAAHYPPGVSPPRSSASSSGGGAQLNPRHELLADVSSTLKTLSYKLQVPVVVTNQVMAKFTTTSRCQTVGAQSEHHLEAALGVAWAHAVNTRFIMQAENAPAPPAGSAAAAAAAAAASSSGLRSLTVAKSPMCAQVRIPYSITVAGWEALPSVKEQQPGESQLAPLGTNYNEPMTATHHMTVGTRM